MSGVLVAVGIVLGIVGVGFCLGLGWTLGCEIAIDILYDESDAE